MAHQYPKAGLKVHFEWRKITDEGRLVRPESVNITAHHSEDLNNEEFTDRDAAFHRLQEVKEQLCENALAAMDLTNLTLVEVVNI